MTLDDSQESGENVILGAPMRRHDGSICFCCDKDTRMRETT